MAALALWASSPAAAQLESVKVWERLQAAHAKLGIETHTPTMYHIAKAKHDGHYSHPHLFLAGTEYAITAACDGDCPDLDLAITRPEEQRTFVADSNDAAVARVSFAPEKTGIYEVEIHVEECREYFCYYGYSLLRETELAEE